MLSAVEALLFAVALPMAPASALAALSVQSVRVVSELPDACPESMQLVDGEYCPQLVYQCDRFTDDRELSCAEYSRKPECRQNLGSRRFCIDRYEWPNREGADPEVFVSWHEARNACRSVGKRLCRRSEWTVACEGPKRAPYPHGWSRDPNPCNVDRARIEVDRARLDDPRSRDAEIRRLWQAHAIGRPDACESAHGVIDMTGNVDEWTDNRESGSGLDSTLNGGYWGPVRNTCRLTTTMHGPGFAYYQIGFRCCTDPVDGIRTPLPSPPMPRHVLESAHGPGGWPYPKE